MAKRGVKTGRWIVTAGLVAFVLVSAAVITRRGFGHREGAAITALERRKADLESERVRLDQEIRIASSRARLVPIAERRLGMRMPAEAQIVVLERPARSSDPR
jgi:cell division protein FtsL